MDSKASLISSQKASDSGLHAILHPLVLLTISDYITRHTLREQKGPIVGALIGQHHGREITIEHAFECAVKSEEAVTLDESWFEQRLDQMKTLYKSPQLDLVGWYTVLPKSGPTDWILPIHEKLLSNYNESSLLLAFHPEGAIESEVGSKLPLTIYESIYEAEDSKPQQGEDKEMRDGEPPLKMKFRELPFSVETGEAEMISMDFVARGAGNATVVEPREESKPDDQEKNSKGKGKGKAKATEPEVENEDVVLSRDDEEMIAALTAKANAIKMLQARIDLLTTYLERLPPSLLTGETGQTAPDQQTSPSYPILRSIQALVNRLSLLAPSTHAFENEMQSETNDVNLMELLNDIMQGVNEVRSIGQKHSIVEKAKMHRNTSQRTNLEYGSERGGWLAGAGVI